MVEVLAVGRGRLVCCGVPMKLEVERGDGPLGERHLPVLEKIPTGIRVRVGRIVHPMEERHFVRWIEARQGDLLARRMLRPGDTPEAEFVGMDESAKIRVYCTMHGLWSNLPEQPIRMPDTSRTTLEA